MCDRKPSKPINIPERRNNDVSPPKRKHHPQNGRKEKTVSCSCLAPTPTHTNTNQQQHSRPLSPKTLRALTSLSISMGCKTSIRELEHTLRFTMPSSSSSSSSPIDTCLTDPTRSGSGSFQNEGVLSARESSVAAESEFGFSRLDFRRSSLAGTVEFYRRHVFLCYKNPRVWPPRIEASEFDRLPRLLYAAVVARKGEMMKETRLTMCEGNDGTETSNGDILIFPDMIRYRRLTHFDVETFVEEVLVKDGEWNPGNPEPLKASYVFVCSHGSRDRRCGVCGPILVSRFREEIELYGLQGKVFVSPCSHIGGHQYAGNVIIFGSSINGEVTGHWYGYVTPEDVSLLLEQHIIKGEILDSLWRGQMGLSEEEQKKSQEQRLHLSSIRNSIEESTEMLMQMKNHEISTAVFQSQDNFASCCQANGVNCCQENDDSYCYQNHVSVEKIKNRDAIETEAKLSADNKSNVKVISHVNGGKGASRKIRSMPTWLDSWEREDTYAALSVAFAAMSVAFAYSCYKQL